VDHSRDKAFASIIVFALRSYVIDHSFIYLQVFVTIGILWKCRYWSIVEGYLVRDQMLDYFLPKYELLSYTLSLI